MYYIESVTPQDDRRRERAPRPSSSSGQAPATVVNREFAWDEDAVYRTISPPPSIQEVCMFVKAK